MRSRSPELETIEREIAVLERELADARTAAEGLPQDDYRHAQKGAAVVREEELRVALEGSLARLSELGGMEREWRETNRRFRQARPRGRTKLREYLGYIGRETSGGWGFPVRRHASILGLGVLAFAAIGFTDSDGERAACSMPAS